MCSPSVSVSDKEQNGVEPNCAIDSTDNMTKIKLDTVPADRVVDVATELDAAVKSQETSSISLPKLEYKPSIMSVRTLEESLMLRTSFTSYLLPKETRPKHTVRFDKVLIREYPVVLGNSPSTSKAPPVSLGWEYEPTDSACIDEYESTRIEGGECERRDKTQLRIPSKIREEMLERAGFTTFEIREATHQLLIDKVERRASMRNYSRMRKYEPLVQRIFAVRERIKKALNKHSSGTELLLQCDMADPLNVSYGRRGSLCSSGTLLLFEVKVL